MAAARILFLAALLVPLAAHAADDEDPIDTAMSACLDTPDGQSTAGMVACMDKAYDAWDAELNKAYGALTDTLDGAQADLLKASQRKWLAYRDAERDFEASLVTSDAGTIMQVTVAGALVEIVKARVLLLRNYVE